MYQRLMTILADATEAAPAPTTDAAGAGGFDLKQLISDFIDHPSESFASVITAMIIFTGVVIFLHFLVAAATKERGPGRRASWSNWERLVYLGVLATVAVLGTTAFYSILVMGSMHRWLLFFHLMGAGAFVVVFALFALTSARAAGPRCCATSSSSSDEPTAPEKYSCFTKFTFWVLLLAGVATAATMLLSMLPIMDTHMMEQMITLHRYSGLLLVVATLMHLYSAWLGRLGWR